MKLWAATLLPFLGPALAAGAPPDGDGRAEAGGDALERERELVRAEIQLESSLACLEPAGARLPESVVPVPELPAPPLLDGDTAERFWRDATAIPLETAGDSLFMDKTAWRIFLARTPEALFIGGERRGALPSLEVLGFQAEAGERLVVRLGPGIGPAALAGSGGRLEPVARGGGELAARCGPPQATFELRLPRGFPLWPAEIPRLRSLRLSLGRGDPAAVQMSGRFHLAGDQAAVRVLEVRSGPAKRVSADCELVNLGRVPLALESNLEGAAVIVPGGRLRLAPVRVPASGPAGIGLDFVLKPGPAGYRIWLPALFADPAGSRRAAESALETAREGLKEVPKPDGLLAGEAETLRGALASPSGDARAAEELQLRSRILRRRVLLAGLPSELREALFVRGPRSTVAGGENGGSLWAVSLGKGELREIFRPPAGASLRDPCLAFDGRRVAYSLESAEETTLSSIGVEGAVERPITGGGFRDLSPAFLPGGGLVFSSTRAESGNPLTGRRSLCLHTVREDGTGLRRISFHPLDDFTPAVLPDGGLVFSRRSARSGLLGSSAGLWSCHPDGSHLAGLAGLEGGAETLASPRPVPGIALLVCVRSSPAGAWEEPPPGGLTLIDCASGSTTSLTGGERGYRDPFPAGRGGFLADWEAGGLPPALYLVDRRGNREPVYRDLERASSSPIPLLAAAEPPRLASASPPGASESGAEATIIIEDLYQGLPEAARGSLKRIRVLSSSDPPPRPGGEGSRGPVIAGLRSPLVRKVLGTVPVQPDGSAYFKAPSRLGLLFQALDREGRVAAAMEGGIAFLPGEHRACIGCHEPRSAAPPAVSRGRLQALDGPPSRIEPEPGPDTLSFTQDIQPVLDRRCLPCHDGSDTRRGLALSGDLTPLFSVAYESLIRTALSSGPSWRPRAPATKNGERPARPTSPLERLLAPQAKPHQGLALSKDEERLFRRWIDLDLPFRSGREPARPGGDCRLLSTRAEASLASALDGRCRGCHPVPDLFEGATVNLSRPALSRLLTAPLSREAGGRGLCGAGGFASASDAAYRAILETLAAESRRIAGPAAP